MLEHVPDDEFDVALGWLYEGIERGELIPEARGERGISYRTTGASRHQFTRSQRTLDASSRGVSRPRMTTVGASRRRGASS
jgi:hypothetical protein